MSDEIMGYQAKIKDLLKNDQRGLNIREISERLNLNRNSVAKLLDILTAKEEVEIRVHGRSKVYYLAKPQNYRKWFDLLSHTIEELNNFPPDGDIYAFIAGTLKRIAPEDTIIFVNSFDPGTKTLTVHAVEGFGLRQPEIEAILCRPLKGLSFSVPDRLLPEMLTGECNEIPGGLTDLTFGGLPYETCKKIEEMLLFGKVFSAGISWKQNLKGTAAFLLPKRAEFENHDLITFFIRQVAGFLSRKEAEEALKESESFNRGLVENLPDYIAVYGLDGNILFMNPASVRALGYDADTLLGTHVLSYITEEYRDTVTSKMASRWRGGDTSPYEMDVITKKGLRRSVIVKATPIQYKKNPAILLLLIDITERKRAEEALHRQSATLSILNEIISTTNKADDLPTLLNSILEESLRLLDFDSGGIYLADHSTRTARVVHSINLPPEFLAEIQPVSFDQKPYDTLFIHNEPIFTENYAQLSPARSKKYKFQSVASIPLLSRGVAIGALNIASTKRHVISDEEKQTLISIGRELGSTIERMAAEEEVKKAAKNLETLFNSIDEMVFVLDMQGHILAVNDAVQQRLLYTSKELTGTNVLLLHVPERRAEASQIVQGMIAGTIESCPVPVLSKDGSCIEVETKVTRGMWNNQEVLIGVSRDVTERKREEEKLAAAFSDLKISEEKFSAAFHSSAALMAISTKQDGKFIAINEMFLETLGFSRDEVIGKRITDLNLFTHPDHRLHALHMLEERGEVRNLEVAVNTKDGSIQYGLFSVDSIIIGKVPCLLTTMVDITEQKMLEKEMEFHEQEVLRFSRSLDAAIRKLNLLSSITRHDINNQLTVLMGYLEILKMQQSDTSFSEYFQKASTAAQRISAMIQFTKEYESIGVKAPVWQDIRTLVNTAAKEAAFGQVILKNDLPAGAEVFADLLIVRVFYNLMDNAVRYGGKVTTIRFSVQESGDDHLIVCEDDGNGVLAEEKEKIFKRGYGKNTGFGLFLAREILDITGITICETGKPGKGARFEIVVRKGAYRITGVQ